MMRLTAYQQHIIRQAARDCFGPGARVTLFGSRADDEARGGDIDLLIATDMTNIEDIIRSEIAFQLQVQQAIGEQKIDLLIDYPGRGEHPPIFEIAERTGVRL
ncbi:nucleotidyltransferase domain-containing protein [Halomonas sp. HK25]|uniref:nucleotidyltransferase domain-containing protein n=1 Tax=Halomonas sp. HK25 TaxID=3394321 RepID=UPI0039FCD34A